MILSLPSSSVRLVVFFSLTMLLSWNEIKSRAVEFSKEWENDFNEHAEAKSFMDAFFNPTAPTIHNRSQPHGISIRTVGKIHGRVVCRNEEKEKIVSIYENPKRRIPHRMG